jgi:O-antigen/teichoic acid export membrane protein
MMTFSEGIKNTSILAPASSAVQLFLFIFLVVVLSDQFQKLSYAIIAFIIGNIFRIIFSFYTVGKFNFNLKKKYLTDLKKLYKFGAASFLANLSVLLLFKLDIFMISSMLGYAELGIYSAAVTLIEMVLIVPTVIGTSLFTHLPTIGTKERIILVRKTLLGVTVMSIFLLIMLSIFGRIIITILFGGLFIEAIYPLLYLMPGIFFMSLNYCFANYFSGIGRPIITGCIFTIGVLINFILNLYFIPILGILGASIASSIAYFFVTLMFIYALWQFEKINSMELFVFSRKEIIKLQFHIKNKLNFLNDYFKQ